MRNIIDLPKDKIFIPIINPEDYPPHYLFQYKGGIGLIYELDLTSINNCCQLSNEEF